MRLLAVMLCIALLTPLAYADDATLRAKAKAISDEARLEYAQQARRDAEVEALKERVAHLEFQLRDLEARLHAKELERFMKQGAQ